MMNTLAAIAGLVVILAFPAGASGRQAAPGPGGRWEGSIDAPGTALQVTIDLALGADGKTWEGTIAMPAQNLTGVPLGNIALSGESVTFALLNFPGSPVFKGTLSKDGKTMTGEFSQGGGSVPFKLSRTGDARMEPRPGARRSPPISKAAGRGRWMFRARSCCGSS